MAVLVKHCLGRVAGFSGDYFCFGGCAVRVTLPLASPSAVAVTVILPELAVARM